MSRTKFAPVFLLVALAALVAWAGLMLASAGAAGGTPASVEQSVAVIAGGPLDTLFPVTAQSWTEISPTLAYNPDRQEYLAVWSNDRAANDDIQAQRLGQTGKKLGNPFYVASGGDADRRNPDVAYNSAHDQYLVVYDYQDASHAGVRGVIVPADGTCVSAEMTIVEAAGGTMLTYHSPAVAYASTVDRYLVAFVYFNLVQDGVQAAAYDHQGNREGTFIALSDNGLYPIKSIDLAYNHARNEFLVVWQQQVYSGGSSQSPDVYGRRVKMSGGAGALEAPLAIGSGVLEKEKRPAVAALPSIGSEGEYLVVFEKDFGSSQQVRGQVLSGTGVPGHEILFPYDQDNNPQFRPAVAAAESANSYLVAWRQDGYAPPLTYNGIVAVAIREDGTLLNGGILLAEENSALGGTFADNPAVAAGDNGDFLILFDDQEITATSRDIFGRLWGHRLYLPFVLRQ